jgi:DNA-binding CsgD family transcriptional regulator
VKRVLLFGAVGGVLVVVLKLVEAQYLMRTYPAEVYAGIVAVLFSALGIWVGLRSSRSRPAPEPALREAAPFAPDPAKIRDLGLTAREREVLALIAEGLSNREIGERLFVSENTVKTHASRLFEKIGVERRVQAVQRGRELGLVP